MMNTKTACKMARELADVTSKDHFGSDAFYANKRIFATVWHNAGEVNLRLSPEQQQDFLAQDSEAFSEVDNAFGKQGWTTCHLQFIDADLFRTALSAAHATASVKRTKVKTVPAKPKAKKKVAVGKRVTKKAPVKKR
jgi:hypothetical protein